MPNEELLHLCEHYGELVDEEVSRQNIKLGNDAQHTIRNSTRSVQVCLHQGKFLKNFYWLAGPNQGERGRRVTVLHNNQPSQCSHCLKYSPPSGHSLGPSQYCKGGGNGKICKALNTDRTSMNDYIKSLKDEDGYTSLRDQHYNSYNNCPALGRKETNKTLDPETTDLEDQAIDDDNDDESDKTGESVDPNEKTQVEETTLPDPEKSAETSLEEATSQTDSVDPDETTTEAENSLTDPEKANETNLVEEISLVETTNDTTHDSPDQTPLPPTKQTPEDENKDPSDAVDIPPINRVRGCLVSMKSMLKSPSIRLPTTPTSPNQSLLPPSQNPLSAPSPSSKTPQGLGLLEFPMIRHMTENRKYNDDELKIYVIEAIKQGEITYKVMNDELEESPILSDSVLKG